MSQGIGQITTMSENGSAIADDYSRQTIERLAKLECHTYIYKYINIIIYIYFNDILLSNQSQRDVII